MNSGPPAYENIDGNVLYQMYVYQMYVYQMYVYRKNITQKLVKAISLKL